MAARDAVSFIRLISLDAEVICFTILEMQL